MGMNILYHNKIFLPHKYNNLSKCMEDLYLHGKNIWLMWQVHSLKIMCGSQKLSSHVCYSPSHSHGSNVEHLATYH
jgi:hypothetical protein